MIANGIVEEMLPDYVVLTMQLNIKPHKKTTQERFKEEATLRVLCRTEILIGYHAVFGTKSSEKRDECLYQSDD